MRLSLSRCAFVGLMALPMFAHPASAALLEIDLNALGDGLITRDTSTGLDWLDLTATLGKSYNEVDAGFGGFIDQGFSFATESQVRALYTEAGIAQIGASTASNFEGVLLLQDLMGVTASPGLNGGIFSQGYAELDVFDPVATSSGILQWFPGFPEAGADVGATVEKDLGLASFGSYLVRPIPEPSTALFLAAGLAALAARRRTLD